MNNTHRINTAFAISKAKEAVKNWEAGVSKAKDMNASADEVKFCEESLRLCRENLAKVISDTQNNWHAYI